MRRVIYCPTQNDLSESNQLAKKNCLPINVGEFEESINLNFDRNIIQILEIPEIKNLSYLREVEKGFHQKINYINDFITFNKNDIVCINDKKYYPFLLEKHRLRFIIEEQEIGSKNVKIFNEERVVEEFEYNVY